MLEESAATLFDAMLAARDAGDDDAALRSFYRALVGATLLLPVPPGTQETARRSLADAISDQEEVEIGVMLARDSEGQPVSVVFGSGASLAAWSPTGSGSVALPGRIVLQNLAASGLPAIVDPAGPIPYRFEPDELQALARGVFPSTEEPIFPDAGGTSVRLRLAGLEADALESSLAGVLPTTPVDEAYLVETDGPAGRAMLLGVVADAPIGAHLPAIETALAARSLPVEILALEEPMLTEVRRLTEPFYRRRTARR